MKDRIIEMLERGERVELECINPDGFARHGYVNERLLIHGKMNIGGYYEDEFSLRLDDEELDSLNICRAQAYINDYELEYFKIKESKRNFNDLIDVAVQAMKDGIIYFRFLSDAQISFSTSSGEDAATFKVTDGAEGISEAIYLINSLYTETFVIKSEEDLNKLKTNAVVTLKNNEEIVFSNKFEDGFFFDIDSFNSTTIPFIALKGATVTQKRGV